MIMFWERKRLRPQKKTLGGGDYVGRKLSTRRKTKTVT
jgi:hypothetical protein